VNDIDPDLSLSPPGRAAKFLEDLAALDREKGFTDEPNFFA
jgi:hypothetical protein